MLASNLKKIREEMHLSKAAFAKMLNIPYTTYNGYETGERQPNYEKLEYISKKLQVPITKLLGWDDKYKNWMLYDMDDPEKKADAIEEATEIVPIAIIDEALKNSTKLFLDTLSDIPDEYIRMSMLSHYDLLNREGKWRAYLLISELEMNGNYKKED